MLDQLYTIKEACALMKVTAPTLYSLVKKGKLSMVKIGALSRISEAELAVFLETNLARLGKEEADRGEDQP